MQGRHTTTYQGYLDSVAEINSDSPRLFNFYPIRVAERRIYFFEFLIKRMRKLGTPASSNKGFSRNFI